MSQLSLAGLHVQRGRFLSRMGKWPEAERQFQKAAAASATPTALYYLGNAQFQLQRFAQALDSTERAVELDDSRPGWLIRLGALYERAGRHADAATAYSRALESEPENLEWQARLRRARSKAASPTLRSASATHKPDTIDSTTGRQAVRTLSTTAQAAVATNIPAARLGVLSREALDDPENSTLRFQLALAQLANGCEDDASSSLAQARFMDPDDVGLLFHHAWALRKSGRLREAEKTAAEGIRRSPDRTLATLGAGAHFQQQGLWEQAAAFFEDRLSGIPYLPDLDYRAGLAHEREYAWSLAGNHYYRALIAEPDSAGRHVRLGLTRERSNDLAGAIDAYAAALRLDPTLAPTWRYRLGYCLHRTGRTREAIAVFRGLHAGDQSQSWTDDERQGPSDYEATLWCANLDAALVTHDADHLETRGIALMEAGMPWEAVRAFEAVVRHDAAQGGLRHFRLAMARLVIGDEAGAMDAFLDVERFRRPVDIGNHSYFEKKWQLEAMEYVEYSEAYPVDEDLVLLESYHGSKIDCNPAAIYRHLRDDPAYNHLRFGWVVTGQCRIPQDVAADPRVSLLRRGSALYRRSLGTAQYLISNVSFPQYFVRRHGQKYLNTWHGTPLKSMGKDISSGFMQHGNVGRNLLHATHLLAPNQHTQDSLIQRYEVEGLFTGRIGRLGSPRVDRMVNTDAAARARILKQLDFDDDGRRIVFYAPTWRGATGEKYFDRDRLIHDLESLGALDAHVLFRAHHLAERVLGAVAIDDVTVVPSDLDTYDVLGVTDVLVTDYSSIFFDFLSAQKPIIFYAYDLEEYVAERGLYFDLEDMPGEVAHSIEQLTASVSRALNHGVVEPEAHERARETFAPLEDGRATERAIAFFFAGSQEHIVELPQDGNQPVLFRHDFEPGAPTDALLSRAAKLSGAGQRVAVLFDRAALADRPERLELLAQLPNEVQRLVRSGPHVVSVEERWNINQFNRSHRFSGREQEDVYRRAYRRDFRRATGEAAFSAVVQVSDLDAVGVALLGSIIDESTRRILVSPDTLATTKATPDAAPLAWYDAVAPSIEEVSLGPV